MKYKSLLLSTSAIMVAVGGATAADLPEAAPADYVAICGDFSESYVIPGTDVCLDISGEISFEVDVSKIDMSTMRKENKKTADLKKNKMTTNYSTDAEIKFTASSATEYGALVGHIELEGDDLVKSQGVKDSASALKFDDVYLQFGGSMFVKAGYYDGVGDLGDSILTSDVTGQGDTVGFGVGWENFSFAVDALLDADNEVKSGHLIESVGAEIEYKRDDLTFKVAGGASFIGSNLLLDEQPFVTDDWDTTLVKHHYQVGGEISYTLNDLTLLGGGHIVRGDYELSNSKDADDDAASDTPLDLKTWTARGKVAYNVTEELNLYVDGEFGQIKAKINNETAPKIKANVTHIEFGADYTLADGFTIGGNAGWESVKVTSGKGSDYLESESGLFFGASLKRTF